MATWNFCGRRRRSGQGCSWWGWVGQQNGVGGGGLGGSAQGRGAAGGDGWGMGLPLPSVATVVAASAVSVAVLSVLPSLMLPPLLLLLQGGALLVTADGAVDCAMDPNRQVSCMLRPFHTISVCPHFCVENTSAPFLQVLSHSLQLADQTVLSEH